MKSKDLQARGQVNNKQRSCFNNKRQALGLAGWRVCLSLSYRNFYPWNGEGSWASEPGKIEETSAGKESQTQLCYGERRSEKEPIHAR